MTPDYIISDRRLGSTSVEVSPLGYGAAALGNLYRKISDDETREALTAAFDAGIRYVDTAPHYGQGLSERRVGAHLRPGTTVSTKVGRVLTPIDPPPPGTERHGFIDGDPFDVAFDYSADGIVRSFEDSLQRLGIDRIDLLLVHDLGRATHGPDAERHMRDFLDGGYRAMADLKASGRVGAIGMGVNEWQVCEDVMAHCDLDAVLLAGRYTLLEQTALDSFLPLCDRTGVSVIVGGPFNSGVLIGDDHYDYGAVPPAVAARVARLKAICTAHGVPLAAAALQFPLAHPAVVSVIPGMAAAAQVEANLTLFSTRIPDALWDELRHENMLHADAPLPKTTVAI
ncbi:aldo/keto reductase [Asticcacaulis sp. 201]|uniref:aldo/keto reductase n=1 Tax=Asticcacaulis sp. 201 TaxID=3028787 RepID=UPI002916512D|nr:aldo/keto reductase [Asticcacaulis sp. 201]MDV6332495.1 aldo/keto reductase [Asticcacaulis sp. 201]